MTEFKFEVGDLVYTRAGIHDALQIMAHGFERWPLAFIVLERLSQQCPGGVQLSYVCGQQGGNHRFNEIELVGVTSFDFAGALATYLVARGQSIKHWQSRPKEFASFSSYDQCRVCRRVPADEGARL